MVRLYSIKRFMGPWLAYAALNGLAVAIPTGVLALIVGGFSSSFVGIIMGFCAGFLNGLVSALIGGKLGYWWNFCFYIGASLFLLSTTSLTVFFLPLMIVGAFGAILPRYFLSEKPLRCDVETPIRELLVNSWLAEPPRMARLSGLILAFIFCVTLETAQITPVFLANKNYVSRIGAIETWQNSRIMLTRHNSRRYSPERYCRTNLKQIMLGVMQYVQDYDERYPPKLTDSSSGIAAALYSYLKSTQIFQCPGEFYNHHSGDYKSGDFTDYYFNSRLYGLNTAIVTSLSTTIAMGDGNTGAGEANSTYSLGGLPPVFPPATRHRNGANYSFADGHVKWFEPTSISNTATPTGISFMPQIQVGARN